MPPLAPDKVDGALIAEALRGSWRSTPPDVQLTAGHLKLLNERLQATGAGGLAWWRIRDSALADSPAGVSLRDAFRIQSLHARLHEERICVALDVLASVGVEPAMIKGWVVARGYPQAGLRPYGDIDLLVAPEELDAAAAALARHAENTDRPLRVDLHSGVPGREGQWATVMERSETAHIGERAFRVLGPEDHLGLLCRHFLSHGAWRPLWLCDIALICESLPGDFDWTYLQAWPRRQV